MSIPRVVLKEESSLITKGTTPTSLGHQFTEKGVPFLRAQNLVDGSVSVSADPLFISSETNDALKRSKIQANDVLISIAGTIGRAAIVPNDAKEMNCNQAVAIVRPSNNIDRRYFLHWLSSEDALSQMAQGKVTGVISNLSLGEIGKLKIPLPSLDEQKRIAGILDQAASLCRLRTRALDKLNTLGQAIFHEMFGDVEDLPKRSFEELVHAISNGVSPSRNGSVEAEVLTLSSITGSSFDAEKRKTDMFASAVADDKRVQLGDFLLCRGNGNPGLVGAGKIADASAVGVVYPDTIIRARLNLEHVSPAYVEVLWKQPRIRYQITAGSKTTNGTMKINQKTVNAIQIPVPNLSRQAEFSRIKSVLEQDIRVKQGRQLEQVNALFASLQHRAFRGDL